MILQRVSELEAAVRDPALYQQLVVKEGLDIAMPPATPEPSVETLEAEMFTMSKEDVLSEWRKMTSENRSLKVYIDRMLALVMEAAPQILERRFDKPTLPIP